MSHSVSLFANPARAGVFRAAPARRAALLTAAEAAGLLVMPVDLSRVRNRAQLLQTLGAQLAFPEWFGGNLDALYDCLTDLGWRPAEGYLLLLAHPEALRQHAAHDFNAVLAVCADAATAWAEQDVPFWCLSLEDDGPLPGLPDAPT